MIKTKVSLLIAILLLFIYGTSGCQKEGDVFLTRDNSTASSTDSSEDIYNEIIVKFKPEAFNEKGELVAESVTALNAEYGLISMELVFKDKPSEDLAYIYTLRFSEEADIDKLVQEYANDSSVVYAEPNYIMRALDKESNAD